jgi:hypothetical protein
MVNRWEWTLITSLLQLQFAPSGFYFFPMYFAVWGWGAREEKSLRAGIFVLFYNRSHVFYFRLHINREIIKYNVNSNEGRNHKPP